MHRRDVLRGGVAVGVAGLAGCAGLFETESARSRERATTVEDREEEVYHPTHREGATTVGTGGEGRYEVILLYSVPHGFWTVSGSETNLVEIPDDASAHLMATIWDADTETVLPTANVSAEISKDGETVDSRDFWPMLSQNMGYHFGDNIGLDGDGTYTATLDVGAMQARGLGDLAGAFAERTTVEVEFDHERESLGGLAYEEFPDEQGEAAALDPMDADIPVAQVPARDDLPGSVVGTGVSGDADFVAFLPDETPEFVADDRTYLAVSPRTPYNRYPLPFMNLSAILSQSGETVFEGALDAAVSPDFGYHYGVSVESADSALSLRVDAPPQVSRHEGYETAFLDMSAMKLTI